MSFQYELDRNGKAGNNFNKNLLKSSSKSIEQRLRVAIESNKDFLTKLAADESETRFSFISQLADLKLDIESSGFRSEKAGNIRLVSVDVNCADIENLVVSRFAETNLISLFLQKIHGDDSIGKDDNGHVKFPQKAMVGKLIRNTHVTMAHISSMTSEMMQNTFGSFVNAKVKVYISAFFVSGTVAAFEVDDLKLISEEQYKSCLPKCCNAFQHITIWSEGPASKANDLPALVSQGEASRFDFGKVEVIDGVLTFWPKK